MVLALVVEPRCSPRSPPSLARAGARSPTSRSPSSTWSRSSAGRSPSSIPRAPTTDSSGCTTCSRSRRRWPRSASAVRLATAYLHRSRRSLYAIIRVTPAGGGVDDGPGGARLGLRDHPRRCDHDHHRDPARRPPHRSTAPRRPRSSGTRTPCASTPPRPSGCRSTRSCTTACSRRCSRPRAPIRRRRRSSPRGWRATRSATCATPCRWCRPATPTSRVSVLANRIADAASALSEPFAVDDGPCGGRPRCRWRSPRPSTRPPCRRWSTACSTPVPGAERWAVGRGLEGGGVERGGRRPRHGLRPARSCRRAPRRAGVDPRAGVERRRRRPRRHRARRGHPGHAALAGRAGRCPLVDRRDPEGDLVTIGVPRAPHRRPRGGCSRPTTCVLGRILARRSRSRASGFPSSSAMVLYALVDGDRRSGRSRDADADLDGVVLARCRGRAPAARHDGARPDARRAATATRPGTSAAVRHAA